MLASASKLIATRSHATVSGSPLLAVNPNAPIRSGDTILLMSGDYGDVLLMNAFNDGFITVAAAPGQTPVIGHLKIGGVARWVFQGLTFRSAYPSGSPQNAFTQVSVTDGWGDMTEHVIFDGDTFQAVQDASGWSDTDWYTRPNYYTLDIRSACVAVTNSTLTNLFNGIAARSTQTLIKGNLINNFANDAMDVTGSNIVIFGNVIQNAKNASPMNADNGGLHPDAIQVWSPSVNGVLVRGSNLLIDSNKITNPKGRPDNYLMGIHIGYYDKVTVQNNAVATNHWLGIDLEGTHDSLIVNNTVMPSDPTGHPSFIMVCPNQGSSQNVVIRNNVAYYIRAEDQSITMDHNRVQWAFSTMVGGKPALSNKGDTALQNLVQPTLPSAFRNWNPVNNAFDLHLAASSSLSFAGAGTLAPSLDADGRPRSIPADLGAYTH